MKNEWTRWLHTFFRLSKSGKAWIPRRADPLHGESSLPISCYHDILCGEAGIRTLGRGFCPYNRLAGGCLQPARPPLLYLISEHGLNGLSQIIFFYYIIFILIRVNLFLPFDPCSHFSFLFAESGRLPAKAGPLCGELPRACAWRYTRHAGFSAKRIRLRRTRPMSSIIKKSNNLIPLRIFNN